MAIGPMQRARALDSELDHEHVDLSDLRAELDSIRVSLDRLLRKAEAAGIGETRRFGRYLATLDSMHGDVVQALDDVEDEADDVDRVARGVREAWARLAIAKTAAEARFG